MNWKLARIMIGSLFMGTLIVFSAGVFHWGTVVELMLTIPAGVLLAVVEH